MFGPKKCWVRINFGCKKNFGSEKNFGPKKNVGHKKIWVLLLGVTGVKQSQLLVYRLSLEFDNSKN